MVTPVDVDKLERLLLQANYNKMKRIKCSLVCDLLIRGSPDFLSELCRDFRRFSQKPDVYMTIFHDIFTTFS